MGESDALIRNVLSIMRNWEREAKIISAQMSRLAWLLDGWSYIVALWTSVENEPHERQRDTILEMARLIPVMPREISEWTASGLDQEAKTIQRKWVRLGSGLANRQEFDGTGRPERGVEGGHAMTTWAELQQLSVAIAQASDEKLIQIVRIVDTLPERTQLDDAIAKVRHRLSWLKPPRPLSLARILFAPVEDLLDGPLHYRRGSKRFSRAIIRPVADIFDAAMGEAKSTAIRAELVGKTTKQREFALAFGERLWPTAADILADFVKRAAGDQRLRTDRIGRDDDVLLQIADMASFLRFGSRIERLKADLPPQAVR